MKKRLALGLLVMAVGGAWILIRHPLRPSAVLPSPENPTSPQGAASSKPATAPSAKIPAVDPGLSLDSISQEAVKLCLGQGAADWAALNAHLETLATGPAKLQWRVASMEENGQEVRLRLEPSARQSAAQSGTEAYQVRLFSVDAEGLPDPLPPRPGQSENPAAFFENFAKGKKLLRSGQHDELPLPGGTKAEREFSDGILAEVQLVLAGKELDCSRRGDHPGCACRSRGP